MAIFRLFVMTCRHQIETPVLVINHRFPSTFMWHDKRLRRKIDAISSDVAQLSEQLEELAKVQEISIARQAAILAMVETNAAQQASAIERIEASVAQQASAIERAEASAAQQASTNESLILFLEAADKRSEQRASRLEEMLGEFVDH